MIDGVDVVFLDDFFDRLLFCNIYKFKGAGVSKLRAGFSSMPSGEDIIIAVFLSQGHG
ncbi:hypothetical protein ES703_102315 [subsurface metagenome]